MTCTWSVSNEQPCSEDATHTYVFGAIVDEKKQPIVARLCARHAHRYDVYVRRGQLAGAVKLI